MSTYLLPSRLYQVHSPSASVQKKLPPRQDHPPNEVQQHNNTCIGTAYVDEVNFCR